ncbi:hypothetical protein [Echinicola rosea]|uniref:Uncharacterized protein n=1 Tax=Echinicola rosea TaxID=1807691 RepID=A0ABQ1UYB5_9BACT|nr:hypothetical protein [Echinicola rosea]GGF29149.1 hypothetical protein GCM10011339_16770 [Echinicola rosea]
MVDIKMDNCKNILPLSLLLSFIFLSTGCIKNESDLISQDCSSHCATLNGNITTGNGLIPFKNRDIEVIWKNTIYLGGGVIRTKAKTKTDDSGYYELNFKVREDEMESGYFMIKIPIDQNYLICGSNESYHRFAFFELKNDTTITTNYGIPYKATLKVNSNGASKLADHDYFSFTTMSPTGINFDSHCGTIIDWSNKNPDQEYIIDVAAEQPVIVRMGIRKGDQYFSKSDTLRLEIGEKLDYIVEFD